MKVTPILALLVMQAFTDARKQNGIQVMSVDSSKFMNHDDFGVATNCGKSSITAKWTPKVLSASGQLTAFINFTVPYDMNGGYAEIHVYNHDDGSEVFGLGRNFQCDDIRQYIDCPLKQNTFLSMNRTFSHLSELSHYLGTYDIFVKVSNDDDQEMLCLNATITLTN